MLSDLHCMKSSLQKGQLLEFYVYFDLDEADELKTKAVHSVSSTVPYSQYTLRKRFLLCRLCEDRDSIHLAHHFIPRAYYNAWCSMNIGLNE